MGKINAWVRICLFLKISVNFNHKDNVVIALILVGTLIFTLNIQIYKY